MTALLTETQRENQDTRLIPLSALQHYAFCPRQCALIHNEQAWAENYLTAQGKALHERVDSGEPETRKGVRFERTGQTISEGALWYMQTRHRVPVVFSDDLRAQTLATIAAVRELLNSGQTPPPDYGKRCKACSLVEICQPELLGKRDKSVGYVAGLFGEDI